jgi:hypothetical protein
MFFAVDYATPSVFESQRDHALLGLSANARRPVRFHGRVTGSIPLFRFTMRALGEAIWSNFTWASASQLDPIITVHPDRIFFEGFSGDESVYAMVIAERSLFEPEGEVQTGTTNVDFTAWLWAALGELRSSRDTYLRIGAEGFEVTTTGAGGRFEAKVELPDSWLRGFLQLQGAMAMPGTRISARPVDLLAALRYLDYTKAKVSPRAIRYEFDPGVEPRMVLEPWEHAIPFVGVEHNYTESRKIRVWGRQRLKLIAPLLPFAERVDIFLKGRSLPHFYAVKMPGLTFVLGLTSSKESGWTTVGSGFGFMRGGAPPDPALIDRAALELGTAFHLPATGLAARLSIDIAQAERSLEQLCRLGRAVYDLETREFRARELFETPIDEKKFYPPDERLERASAWLAGGAVGVASCQPEEQRKSKKIPSPDGVAVREVIYRNWRVHGVVDDQQVELALSETGRLIFGKCGCRYFADNLLNQGPCAHMLALLQASEDQRRDGPSSVPSSQERVIPTVARNSATGERFDGSDEDAG